VTWKHISEDHTASLAEAPQPKSSLDFGTVNRSRKPAKTKNLYIAVEFKTNERERESNPVPVLSVTE
jgi:hypothetical protein